MSIKETYINKQNSQSWVNKFQSTAQDQCGKIFSCLNVNFRGLESYYKQLYAFAPKSGLKRSEWNDFQDTGQEKDKHRVPALKCAKFIDQNEDVYTINEKGRVLLELYEDDSLTEKEKWLLTYMLLLDYDSEIKKNDIIISTVELLSKLERCNVKPIDVLKNLKDLLYLEDKKELFESEIFWLFSFADDEEFLLDFLNSTDSQKKELYEYVNHCSLDKKSKDCIAHKFVSGGAYTAGMYNQDINIIFLTILLLVLQTNQLDYFLKLVSKIYYTVDYKKCITFVTKNSKVFYEAYNNSIMTINNMIGADYMSINSRIHEIEVALNLTNSEEKLINYDTCERVDGGENVILYGVPGAGKSWTINNEYCSNDNLIERLVFHPDYTYSDFVGQILPQLDENSNVSYKFTPGPFTKILKKAYLDPINHYYLVIEEVNRGNAPAIFGDVFQLLDRNGKGASEYSITNSDVAIEVYGDANHKVSLPSNLSILGTMNTSDQNVFTLDTAFQRRWSMRLIENKFDKNNANDVKFAGTKILDTDVTWEKFFTEINTIILNKNIRMTSSEDKRLGTHFIQIEDLAFDEYDGTDNKLKTVASKHNRKFAEKVLKYLWDDAFKFNKDEIFDIKEMNSLEKVISTFMGEKGNKRFEKILKQNIYDALVPKQTN